MHTIRTVALLALLIAAPAVAGAATTALQCGNVYDSKSARLVGAGTIVVTDGRIAQVLRERDDAGRGRDRRSRRATPACPGWIDLHVHLVATSRTRRATPKSFRLDDTDFAFRSVGYAEEDAARRLHHACATSAAHVALAPAQRHQPGARARDRASTPPARRSRTTGGHADPPTAQRRARRTLLGPPGPTEGVINGVDDARQAVRQRYKDGADLIKITATGGVLSLREERRRAAVHRRGGQGHRRDREGLRLHGRRARARQGRHAPRDRGRRRPRSSTAPTWTTRSVR